MKFPLCNRSLAFSYINSGQIVTGNFIEVCRDLSSFSLQNMIEFIAPRFLSLEALNEILRQLEVPLDILLQ